METNEATSTGSTPHQNDSETSNSNDNGFSAGILKIRDNARISTAEKKVFWAKYQPKDFILAMVEQESAKYLCMEGFPASWGEGDYQTLGFYSSNSIEHPLIKALTTDHPQIASSSYTKQTTHFAIFLWRCIQKNEKGNEIYEIFVLYTHFGYMLARSFADGKFPRRIAQRLATPTLHIFEYHSLSGEKQFSTDTYGSQGFELEGNEIESIWRIYQSFRAYLKPKSSFEGLFYTTSDIKKKKGEGKAPMTVIEVGIMNLKFPNHSFTIDQWHVLLDHLSKIDRGNETYGMDGKPEVDEPAFKALDNIEKVYDFNLNRKLDKGIQDLIWKDYQNKGKASAAISIVHPHYRDYYRAEWYTLKFDRITYPFTSPPTYQEILAGLKVLFEHRDVDDIDEFYSLMHKVKFAFSSDKSQKKLKLLGLLYSEVRLDEYLYFRIGPHWYQVTGDHLAILQRDFFSFIQKSLRDCSEKWALTQPWILKEDWVKFDSTDLPSDYSESYWSYVLKSTFQYVKEDGQILNPTLTRAILYDKNGKRVEKYRGLIKKNMSELTELMKTKQTEGKVLSIEDLTSCFQNNKDAKAAADSIFSLLTAHRPCCFHVQDGGKLQRVLDDNGYVIFSALKTLKWSNSKPYKVLRDIRDKLESLLKQKEPKTPVTAEELRVMTPSLRSAELIIKHLKKGAPLPGTSSYYMTGPPPKQEKDPSVLSLYGFLCEKYTAFSQVCEEEGYNRMYLNDPNFLVLDQVFPGDREKIEIGDVLYIGDPKRLYIFAIKASFGRATTIACSQIRVAARRLYSAQKRSDDHLIRDLYERSTSSKHDSIFRKCLRERLKTLPNELNKPAIDVFVELFQRELVFVYAFADDGVDERVLKEELNPSHSFSAEEFQAYGKTNILDLLKTKKYLDPHCRLTQTFLTTIPEGFKNQLAGSGLNKKEISRLYNHLNQYASQFPSVSAKEELTQLKRDLEQELGLCLLVQQIFRSKSPPKCPPEPVSWPSLDVPDDFEQDIPLSLSSQSFGREIQDVYDSDYELPSIFNDSPDNAPPVDLFEIIPSLSNHLWGIPNPSKEDCFLISALQLTLHSDLGYFLADENHLNSSATFPNKKGYHKFRNELRKICIDYKNSSDDISVRSLRSALEFPTSGQQDAWEALNKMLCWYDGKGKAIVQTVETTLNMEERKPSHGDDFEMVDESGIKKGFPDHTIIIPLEVPKKQGHCTLTELISHWTAPVRNTDQKLEPQKIRFKGAVYSVPVIQEQVLLDCFPSELFFGVKLFGTIPDDTSETTQVEKIKVKLQLDNFEIQLNKSEIYLLRGFITHTGTSLESGHYLTYMDVHGSWYCFDDERVTQISPEQIQPVFELAYILYFLKKN